MNFKCRQMIRRNRDLLMTENVGFYVTCPPSDTSTMTKTCINIKRKSKRKSSKDKTLYEGKDGIMVKEDMDQIEETSEAVSADENSLICSLTGEQNKATDKERTLQQIIRTLTSEYNFDTENMARDYKVTYIDPDIMLP